MSTSMNKERAARGPKHAAPPRGDRNKRGSGPDAPVWIYGRHAVAAALENGARRMLRLAATRNAADWLAQQAGGGEIPVAEDLKPEAIDKLLPHGAVHQGLAGQFTDLPRARLKDVCAIDAAHRPVVVLDQITDPQNIGAIFRSAAAFGARAVVVQDRRTPPLSGALAKAAAGAVERVACVRAVNIARALQALRDLGYHCAGLAGAADDALSAAPREKPIALVLGAEGAGLRQLVGETCDGLYRIDMAQQMESLNVSNAAAVSLYELTRDIDLTSL